MQKIILLLLAVVLSSTVNAQHTLSIAVKDRITGEPLAGVTIRIHKLNTAARTDEKGMALLNNVPVGTILVQFSHTGYVQWTDTVHLPEQTTLDILLEADKKELDEVVVQSTRTSRTIKNTPTRVETIDGEELDEKNNMRPANVSMLLHESTGLQVQQTSATSGNASIRVQGLDGRYTQLLKDGYPNFGNFASGLSILEIPPLDLKQVEVIKGPASTLYGGGAIAGVVNFISKLPKEKREGLLLLNQSHVGQTNAGLYLSQKKGKMGYALLGLLNFQKAYDVDKDQFSELPHSNSFTIHPRVYFYVNPSVTIMLGNSFTRGDNTGGDMQVINHQPDANHVYYEKNRTTRNTTMLELDKLLGGRRSLKLKQSISLFDRHLSTPGYNFSGMNTNSFTDLSIIIPTGKHTMIGGMNLVYDQFKEEKLNNLDGRTFTSGIYFQDTWDISNKIKMENGLRTDLARYKNNNYSRQQVFVLPRTSVLFRINERWSSRIGAGLGYKMPTIFTEQTESLQYKNILALNGVKAEKSAGVTADINYKTVIGQELVFSINQLFYYTQINAPLVLTKSLAGDYSFANAAKPVTSKGFETNVKFIYHDELKLFVGYTLTDAKATYLTGNQFLPLLPRHKLNLTLMYEKEDNFKLGLEGYFTDRQYLYNGDRTPSFWELGFSAQKTVGAVSFFINFENFTDQRQSNYKRVVNPPDTNPTFDDIWNHTEGFVVNGGLKWKW